MSAPLELVDLVPGTHLGHYVITEKIAQGGMGTVFKALEPALERYVAIKVLRPEYASNANSVQYFQEEARAVAALRHPNIVPIFYIGQEGNVVFFSMAYIDGETFDDYIEGKRWFNEEHAKWFLSHAIAALHSAHKANIVHLDIKPANFLVDRANNIMLTDFGLAQKIVKDAGEGAEREAFGTPAYVSPEQITRGATDQRTDIYSLGATLFHLMTGRAPFGGTSVEDIIWGHLEKPIPGGNRPGSQHAHRLDLLDQEDDGARAGGSICQLSRVAVRPRKCPQLSLRNGAYPGAFAALPTRLHPPYGLQYPDPARPAGPNKIQMGNGSGYACHIDSTFSATVDDAMKNRLEPLKVHALLGTIRDLCQPCAEEPAALMQQRGEGARL